MLEPKKTKSESDLFPRAILHVDGDAFFVACELASKPWFKGKPVVTGKERGIVSALSYEAKARGVSRGMSLHIVRKICPEVIVLESDYDTYVLYSQRMYNIVRKYTPEVEEYGIDECFADITGCQKLFSMSYENVVKMIKEDLDQSLGLTFSLGLSVNKVLAKIGSKWNKPSGITIISQDIIPGFLAELSVGKVWGIGSSTAVALNKRGISTAGDLAEKSPEWVHEHFSKPLQEIHRELRGELVLSLSSGPKDSYDSISKTRSFKPPSSDPAFLFSQLSQHVEDACIKLRRHNLRTMRFSFFLKTQEFSYQTQEVVLSQPISTPSSIISAIKERFSLVYRPNVIYRATGVTLSGLDTYTTQTTDLFGNSNRIQASEKIFQAVDELSLKYGKHILFLGSSFDALGRSLQKTKQEVKSPRVRLRLRREAEKRKIGIPFLGVVA